ncbi:hypothetical protein GCM10010404_88120 [Nonomuraea africana]
MFALVMAAGCSVDTGPPARTAERFSAAVAAGRGEEACRLLAARTMKKLPDPGQTCGEALTELALPNGPVLSVSLWGDDAQVRLNGDTLFLHRYDGGWRVRAAGCTPTGAGLPYDCEVED